MLLSILSVVLNIGFFIVLNADLYTDRAAMPDGQIREWQRSPADRLNISDQPLLLYLYIAFAVISIVTALLVLFGVKNSIIKVVRTGSFIASAIMFVIIMIVTSNTHSHYTY